MPEKLLSIFFDESGDQGLVNSQSPFYILSMVFHNQSVDISNHIYKFNDHLCLIGQNMYPIHTGPLIRKEPPYEGMQMDERKGLFTSLFNFMRKTEVKYSIISFDKRITCTKSISVADVLDKNLNEFLSSHANIFKGFDKIIGYYDNGQKYLSTIIYKALKSLPMAVEMRKSKPIVYKLEQVADLVCTMGLLNLKVAQSTITKSELDFFGGVQKLKKNYLKQFKRNII